jgi:hypothetical protein
LQHAVRLLTKPTLPAMQSAWRGKLCRQCRVFLAGEVAWSRKRRRHGVRHYICAGFNGDISVEPQIYGLRVALVEREMDSREGYWFDSFSRTCLFEES